MVKWVVQTEKTNNQQVPPVKRNGEITQPASPCLAIIAGILQNLFSKSGGRGGNYAAR